MALRATGRLLSERLSRGVSRNFSAHAAESPKSYRKDYEARLEKLLKTEARIIESGNPQLIKEFKELKNIAQYNEKVYEARFAKARAVKKAMATVSTSTIGVAAYYFYLSLVKIPQMEEKKLMDCLQCRVNP